MKRVSAAVALVVLLHAAMWIGSAQFGVYVSKRVNASDYGAAAITGVTGYVGAAAGAWAGLKVGAMVGGAAGGPVGAFVGGLVGTVGGAL